MMDSLQVRWLVDPDEIGMAAKLVTVTDAGLRVQLD
jgi:hypothetical protein